MAAVCLCISAAAACDYKIKPVTETPNMINKTETHQLVTTDKKGTAVTLAWCKTSLVAPAFAASMAAAWELAKAAYLPVEMQFLKAFPAVVESESYFKPFQSLFAHGIAGVDWQAAELVMTSILKGHFVFDPAGFNTSIIEAYGKDDCYFVAAKNPAGKMLGFVTFLVRANYPANTVKIMSLAVDPEHQNRGLGKVLMASTFHILPATERIALCTRVTNRGALGAYRAWGFVDDQAPLMDHAFNQAHWSFLTYAATNAAVLQQVAANFVEHASQH